MVDIAPIRAERIAEVVEGTLVAGRADKSATVRQLGEPLEVGDEGVAFVIAESFLKDVAQTKASVLVVQSALAERAAEQAPPTVRAIISAKDSYVGLARLSAVIAQGDPLLDWPAPAEAERFPPRIGPRTIVHPGAVIGPGVTIGADTVIFPGVVVYPRTTIGDRVRIHANCVIGADGFGYARGPQGSVKIWHLGRVVIQDDVEIGAGTMIDRGTMKDTLIEKGAKIDNLCQIGHNGHIRAHAILCAQVGLAGNVTIGRGAILAGKVGVADKIEIGDGALIGPMSGLSKDVKPGEQIMGQHPAKGRREWWKLLAHLDRLPELAERVKKLEKKESS